MTAINIATDGPVIAEAPSEFKVRPRALDVLVPLGDRIVVRPDSAEEMIGSFYVPDVAKEKPARGTIMAVGPDVNHSVLKPGDRVLYGHFTGSDAVHEGEEVLILRAEDVYCTIASVLL